VDDGDSAVHGCGAHAGELAEHLDVGVDLHRKLPCGG
jgi:hypothetical protein